MKEVKIKLTNKQYELLIFLSKVMSINKEKYIKESISFHNVHINKLLSSLCE